MVLDKLTSAKTLIDKLVEDKSFAIVISGKDAMADESKELESYFNERYPELEIYLVDGGQEVYDYILVFE